MWLFLGCAWWKFGFAMEDKGDRKIACGSWSAETDPCRSKKRKCDGLRPVCSRCLGRKKNLCSYTDPLKYRFTSHRYPYTSSRYPYSLNQGQNPSGVLPLLESTSSSRSFVQPLTAMHSPPTILGLKRSYRSPTLLSRNSQSITNHSLEISKTIRWALQITLRTLSW